MSKWSWVYLPGLKMSRMISYVAFAAVMLVMSIVYGYQEILFKPPQGLHQWRQADCLSITDNYSDDDAHFLEGEIHYRGGMGSGKTMSEFPVFYYLIGRVWSTFGRNEVVFRCVVLILFYVAMFALFASLSAILKDRMLSLFITTLMFTSPMLAFYANNFLMNVPALSMVFIGWRLVQIYTQSFRPWPLVLGILFFMIAGLLKASAGLSLIVVFGLFLIRSTKWSLNLLGIPHVPYRLLGLSTSMASFVVLATWYKYSHDYTVSHANSIFSSGYFQYGNWIQPGSDPCLKASRSTFNAIISGHSYTLFSRFFFYSPSGSGAQY
ncbi:MAG: hypothetical protein IPP33_08960 [Flavobacteriales bacterium]|nr:hypothetical protein [Flavobacteriales bacterium]